MRLQLFVLPAVLLDIAAAGLIRTNRYPVRYVSDMPQEAHLTSDRPGLHARFHNSSSIPEAILQSSTLIPSLTPSPILLKAAQTQSAVATSGQVGSVPAFGSGPGAATTEEAKSHASTSTPHPSTSSHRSQEKDTVAQPEASTSTFLSSAATPLSNATAESNTQEPTQGASAKPSAAVAGAGTGSQQPSAGATNAPNGDNSNIAMALGFNSVWATMDANSPCDANNKNEAVACINGQYAQCSNGKYALTACPLGQQCFALPLSKDFKGVTVQCASLQDASQRLGQKSATPAVATPSQSTSSRSQQPVAGKPTVTPTTSTFVQSTAAGSAQATPTQQQPSAVQPSKSSPANSTPSITSDQTTFVGQQPNTTPKGSATTQTKSTGSIKPSTTTSETQTNTTTSKITSSSSQEQNQTPTPSAPSPSAKPTKPTSAAPTNTDDPIIITPIPDSAHVDVQPTVSPAKVAIPAAQQTTTPAPLVLDTPVTVKQNERTYTISEEGSIRILGRLLDQ